jgi:hypothetical protein
VWRVVGRSRPPKPLARLSPLSRCRLLPAILAAASAFPVFRTAAQEAPRLVPGLVVGRVTDTLGAPLSYCFVRIENAHSAVLCDSAGRFRLRGLSRELTTFEVRRLGYVPGRFTAMVLSDSMEFTIQLVPVAAILRPITVAAPAAPAFTPWLVEHGFYERMRAGVTGIFITPEELERLRPQRVTQVLQDRPGIKITFSGGGLNKEPITVVWGRNFCLLNVFVDGIEVRGIYTVPEGVRRGGVSFYGKPGWTGGGGGSIGGMGIDAFLQPGVIAAMEIYPSGPNMPIEFRTTNECGAIVIWTKVGTRPPPGDSGTSQSPPADTGGVHK